MNAPIRRLTTVVALMFLALMVSATSVQFFQAEALNNDSRNVRTVYREFGRDRGPIVVAGEPIASSHPVDDVYGYQRTYDPGPLYAHLTGYFSTAFNAVTGLEKQANDVLNGTSSSLFLRRVQNLVTGNQPQGGAVELTLDPAAQQAAAEAIGDRSGAVVALDPATGAILAMYSSPSFDPNALATHDREAAQAAWDALRTDPAKPLDNRAIAGDQWAPGSSFKVITAAALLESGQYDPDTMVPAPTELTLPQTSVGLRNPGGRACGDGSGEVTLLAAFRQSCNTPFAQLSMDIGYDALRAQAEAFGFGAELEIPLAVTPSRLPEPESQAQLAMSGIGEASVRVTPLQMAMVAAAVANDGAQMRPYLVARELTADLEEVTATQPRELRRSVSPETADQLTQMMLDVVENGTGRPAQIDGVAVAGKTGTAENQDAAPHSWFTGFAPAEDPQVAVAVLIENGGDGGTNAGPVARAVMQAVLQ
ncbi:penicillin-binding protein 2 [Georgenia sp. TF02-10]|uniref:peptidoglycan D,D-transpeptidase FtsI family protein n=1 Tax=Georgenia sp. TF02-10 TaxID=2917725 RepID=UPI001FA7182C|nr:penicillin-binding transpeptidase domain-containing protein [Georgenia sp. TF02-10]UNX54994.1 penicillin-binding protein 2 [Georgenia sp. TF02-10]